ncbi:uncharacterized protein LOC110706249 isoform X1 [Chenopodium quinoa]|uniref:uncharacterized protein LOC110706249 isoform X1 n=1 Tax=Chenopodium quinoa TaxID=63459 RepID=UPI000B777464|nr:uncharacterized protein LOC110706249 isoform X1 [Chenopodium quinoa]XP_021739832.1 uncharacterized protein LOC110706249 isoform X1 [Chenopodium quinoa]XP_021739833.1 uncharacterized protein LOC110706249 isoform X1 [Chenopodium quinoa]XP_021739834.1 uncharacterized protein LOC110706249 isoform X1 [Chenopodium quinoa]XP_021739835.1 uncharacterized protein LOC110706249 isoform X1 [Chenopodium quinoa]XP_021739836.1 uncharacterized protein LOC110706249 isoform X1 [Chenopodium quinoa]XP_02173983
MDQISASKKAGALLRASIMQQKRTSSNSPAKETPIAGTSKPSSSQQPDSKVRKTIGGSTPGSARKQSADKQPVTPQSVGNPPLVLSRPPRGIDWSAESTPLVITFFTFLIFLFVFYAGGPQEPDLVQMAKSMIKVVPQEERDAVKGVGTLDLGGIMGLLSETKLRVHGLLRPISAYNKEAQATSTIHTELEAAKKKNNELEATVKSLRDELGMLRQKMTQFETMEKSLAALKECLQQQEKSLTDELSAKAEKEKMELVQAMMDDSAQIMKMTWTNLFPKSNYAAWEKKFNACPEKYNQQIMRHAAESSSEEEEEDVALRPIEVDASKEAAPDAETSYKDASQNQASLTDQATVNTETLPQS